MRHLQRGFDVTSCTEKRSHSHSVLAAVIGLPKQLTQKKFFQRPRGHENVLIDQGLEQLDALFAPLKERLTVEL